MKKLSVEQKAKAYDKAIERAKRMFSEKEVKYLFPALKEDDDEKIMKILRERIIRYDPNNEILIKEEGISQKQFLDWFERQDEHKKFRDGIQVGDKVTRNRDGMLVNLSQLNRVAKKYEKQGEQKPVNINYISGIREELLDIENNAENIDGLTESQWVAIRAAHRLLGECITKEQKFAWSEEDRDYYDATIAKLELTRYDALLTDNQMAFLKSFKDRYFWKPTDAQIASLTIACDRNDRIGFDLTQLLRDLKKLKE